MNKQAFSGLAISITFILSVSLAFAADEKSQCYTVGYSYDYDKKRFYYSNMASYFVPGNGCLIGDTHARNEWNDYFSSEINGAYNYTRVAINRCECNGDNKALKYVKKKSYKIKGKYRSKGFKIRRLKKFYPSDY